MKLEVDQEFTEFTHLGSASHQVGERLKSNLISGELLDTLIFNLYSKFKHLDFYNISVFCLLVSIRNLRHQSIVVLLNFSLDS